MYDILLTLHRHKKLKVFPVGGAVSSSETWWTPSRMRISNCLATTCDTGQREEIPPMELSGGITRILS